MVAVAIAILGLAAGVHLLMRAKEANHGMFYKLLAWKVILISGLFIVGGTVIGWKHMHHCQESGQCSMHKGESCSMKGGDCKMESADCCKAKMDCCKAGEEKDCCKEMKSKGGCPEMAGEMKDCCKDMKGGKGACSEMSGADAKPACCMDHTKSDSTAKK
jgi:hypothetical protein